MGVELRNALNRAEGLLPADDYWAAIHLAQVIALAELVQVMSKIAVAIATKNQQEESDDYISED